MDRTKKIMILDVEGMSECNPYNIGYIIGNLKGCIYEEKNFAVMNCISENLEIKVKRAFNTAQENAIKMTYKNIFEILNCYGEWASKYKHVTTSEFIKIFQEDIKKYNISEIWAYNCSFDKRMVEKIVTVNGVEWFDIWAAIVMTKCLTKKYVRYCRENGFVTEKGNCKTSAEVVYGYLIKDPNFIEEHTGLADSRIEYKILLNAKKQKKKIDGKKCQPWKMIKNFCEVNGI